MKWVDEALRSDLAVENADEDDLVNLQNPSPIKNHRESRLTRSAIKGTKSKLRASSEGLGSNALGEINAGGKSKFLAKTSTANTQQNFNPKV